MWHKPHCEVHSARGSGFCPLLITSVTVTPPPEFHRVSAGIWIWHRYDGGVKTDVFSTALATDAGVFLIDPIAPPPPELELALAGSTVAGAIITNGNHARAAADFAREHATPIYARRRAEQHLGLEQVCELEAGSALACDLTALLIDGAAPGEIALHCTRDGGTLVMGDALINMGSQGFAFLPAKYCENVKLMRRSLRSLLDYEFQRLLFAHGTPIVTRARSRLAELLDRQD